MRKRHEPAWRRLLRQLQTGSDTDAVEASKALGRCRSRNCADALVALMLRHGVPRASELAAYALAWMDHPRFTRAFVACLCDQGQHEAVRGQAAEALGILFMCVSSPRRQWCAAEEALLGQLGDSSAAVRFWCCYALGSLRSERALVPLERLRLEDPVLVPGWWYVHEEAADAIEWINGRLGEARIPVHLRRDG